MTVDNVASIDYNDHCQYVENISVWALTLRSIRSMRTDREPKLLYAESQYDMNKRILSEMKKDDSRPDQHWAHMIMDDAEWRGELPKQACEVCGSTTRIHRHLSDYSKPLDITWLCGSHHGQEHARLRKEGREVPQINHIEAFNVRPLGGNADKSRFNRVIWIKRYEKILL